MAAPRTLLRESTFRMALWNNVVIANIEGGVDAGGVRQMSDAYLSAHKQYPEGIAAITMLRSSLKVGASDTNAEAKRAMAELRNKMLHVAIVIEDKGMLASLIKAVIRTLNSIARDSILSIAPDLDQAVRSVAPTSSRRKARRAVRCKLSCCKR